MLKLQGWCSVGNIDGGGILEGKRVAIKEGIKTETEMNECSTACTEEVYNCW